MKHTGFVEFKHQLSPLIRQSDLFQKNKEFFFVQETQVHNGAVYELIQTRIRFGRNKIPQDGDFVCIAKGMDQPTWEDIHKAIECQTVRSVMES